MRIDEIIRRPIPYTEKARALRPMGRFIFEVGRDANKAQIRQAIETAFGVKVVAVNTMIVRGKERRMGRGHARTQNWKKAMVTLAEGQTIDLLTPETASPST